MKRLMRTAVDSVIDLKTVLDSTPDKVADILVNSTAFTESVSDYVQSEDVDSYNYTYDFVIEVVEDSLYNLLLENSIKFEDLTSSEEQQLTTKMYDIADVLYGSKMLNIVIDKYNKNPIPVSDDVANKELNDLVQGIND